MATFLRIRNWNQHFENNRSREILTLHNVLLPAKLSGDGYTELLDHPDGAAHYGAWVAMVCAAAISQARRTHLAVAPHLLGTLFRDITKPHDAASLSRLTRIPSSIIETAIERLIAIEWMERIDLSDNELQELDERCDEGAVRVRETCGKGATKVRGGGKGGVRNAPKKRAEGDAQRRLLGIQLSDLTFPTSLETTEARAAMEEWLQYKRARGESYKKAAFAQKMLNEFAALGAAAFVAAVNYSIGRNYAGLFPAKDQPSGTNSQSAGRVYQPNATGVGDI